MAAYPFWVVNVAEINDGVLAGFLLAATLVLAGHVGQEGGIFWGLLLGLLLAAACLVRPAWLPFGFVALQTVELLDSAGELLTSATDHIQVIVRELAPAFLDSTAPMCPVARDAIPIHWLHGLIVLATPQHARAAGTGYVVGTARRDRHRLSDITGGWARDRSRRR